jgi:hypothetical protein
MEDQILLRCFWVQLLNDETLDREEFASIDDLQLLPDCPVEGICLVLALQVVGRCASRTLPQELGLRCSHALKRFVRMR